MSIVSAVEDVHSVQFKWQSDNTYLTGNVNELPLVVMGNMDKSPATRSIDLLVRALLHDQDFSDDTSYAFNFVRAFLNLHSGWGNAQQMIWYLQYTVYRIPCKCTGKSTRCEHDHLYIRVDEFETIRNFFV